MKLGTLYGIIRGTDYARNICLSNGGPINYTWFEAIPPGLTQTVAIIQVDEWIMYAVVGMWAVLMREYFDEFLWVRVTEISLYVM